MTSEFDAMRRLQRDLAQQAQAIQSLLGPGFAIAQETISRVQAQHDEVIGPLRKTIDEMDRVTRPLRATWDLAGVSEVSKMIAALHAEQARWLPSPGVLALTESAALASVLALQGAVQGLLPALEHTSNLANADSVRERLLGPLNARVTAITEASALFRVSANEREQRALSLAIVAASQEAVAIGEDLTALAASPLIESPEARGASTLNLPELERAELLEAVDDTRLFAPDAAALLSPSKRIADRALRILRLIRKINETAKMLGLAETFKPTIRGYEAAGELVSIVAVTEETFGAVIDGLYFLLYEGAGTDNLRFLGEHGGFLKRDECPVIWWIKHLRLRYRHDIDHGGEKNIQKKWLELGEDLQALGLTGLPDKEVEFRLLQERLFAATEQFLELLLERLRAKSSAPRAAGNP